MTPKEQAKELFDKFCFTLRTEERGDGYFTNVIHAKRCAIISLEELIECTPSVNRQPPNNQKLTKYTCEYWKEVKTELEKIE
jgi:hypothetical protein